MDIIVSELLVADIFADIFSWVDGTMLNCRRTPVMHCIFIYFVQVCISISITSIDINQSWNHFMDKSIKRCLPFPLHVSKGHRMIGFHQTFSYCVSTTWSKCLTLSTEHPSPVNHAPCFTSHFHWMFDTSYHIHVHHHFQVNLTFTEFHLKRALSGCIFHKLWVSLY